MKISAAGSWSTPPTPEGSRRGVFTEAAAVGTPAWRTGLPEPLSRSPIRKHSAMLHGVRSVVHFAETPVMTTSAISAAGSLRTPRLGFSMSLLGLAALVLAPILYRLQLVGLGALILVPVAVVLALAALVLS